MKQNIDSEFGVIKGTSESVSLICFLNESYQSTKKNINFITTAKQITDNIIFFNSNLVMQKKLRFNL